MDAKDYFVRDQVTARVVQGGTVQVYFPFKEKGKMPPVTKWKYPKCCLKNHKITQDGFYISFSPNEKTGNLLERETKKTIIGITAPGAYARNAKGVMERQGGQQITLTIKGIIVKKI